MKVVEKAFAYITHKTAQNELRLLVFQQPDFPEAGAQVPAGTINAGEAPDMAVLREAEEETGLAAFDRPRFLGLQEFDARPFGKTEIHRRHFFHLQLSGNAPENWRHYERDPSDGSGQAIAFDLYWLPLETAQDELVASHGQLLHLLQEAV